MFFGQGEKGIFPSCLFITKEISKKYIKEDKKGKKSSMLSQKTTEPATVEMTLY